MVRVNCTPTSPRDQRAQSPQHAIAIAASAARPCQWEADTKPWLGSQPTGSVVLTHGLNGEPLRFPLHLFYVPDSLAKGTPVNRSIYKLTNGLAPRKWSGNVSLYLVSSSPLPPALVSVLRLSSSVYSKLLLLLLNLPFSDLAVLRIRSSLSNTAAHGGKLIQIVRQTTCRLSSPTSYRSPDDFRLPLEKKNKIKIMKEPSRQLDTIVAPVLFPVRRHRRALQYN